MQHTTPTTAAAAPSGRQSAALHARTPEALHGVGAAPEAVSVASHKRERRGVAETSAEAFHSLSPLHYLAPKEAAVLRLFTGPQVKLSRQQIAERIPMPLCGVCGRVDSLLAAKHLEEAGHRRDPHTGKRQKLLQLPREAQAPLPEVSA